MKKLIVLFALIAFVAFSWGAEITMKSGCNVRSGPITGGEKPGVVGTVAAGEVLTVLETHADWFKVKVLSGSDNAGKKGWMWTGIIDGNKVSGKGGALRFSASSKAEKVCFVKDGAILEIIEQKITWYHVKSSKVNGWVYKAYVKDD